MPGFFEALNNFKPKETQKPTIEIQGIMMETSLELFKKVQMHGAMLTKSEKGYVFVDNDPYWPKEFTQGGYTWQIELE